MVRNMKDGNQVTVKLGLGWILFFIYLTLKLTDTISWSWWWVTSPLWIPLAASAVIAILAVIHLIKK